MCGAWEHARVLLCAAAVFRRMTISSILKSVPVGPKEHVRGGVYCPRSVTPGARALMACLLPLPPTRVLPMKVRAWRVHTFMGHFTGIFVHERRASSAQQQHTMYISSVCFFPTFTSSTCCCSKCDHTAHTDDSFKSKKELIYIYCNKKKELLLGNCRRGT